MGMAAPRGGPCPLPPLQEPAVVPRRIPSRAAGAAQGTEGLAYVHRLKGGPGMKPLPLEPCTIVEPSRCYRVCAKTAVSSPNVCGAGR